MTYTIHYERNPHSSDIEVLGDGISAYAKLKKNLPPIEYFAFFVYNENKKIIGGCNGSIYYGCLYVDQLWVDEKLRGRGLGSELIERSENLAKKKKCLFATVNTMDWEALGFYEKLGYQIEYQRSGYLQHSILYFLRKDL